MIKGPKKTVSVILPLELYEWLAVLAQDTARTVPGYIRQVLKSYLWHLENRPEAMGDWPPAQEYYRRRPGSSIFPPCCNRR